GLKRDRVVAFSNPPTGRLGIVHFCLQKTPPPLSQIPQPGGWGSFILAYKRRRRDSLKSPNREVGDRSFLPTKDADATLSNPPTGRLGIVHSCLQKTPTRLSQIPQPGGWGSFILAYKRRRRDSLKSPNREVGDRSFLPTKDADATLSNPPTGRLGIVHSCLQKTPTRLSQIPQPGGWGSFILAYKRRRRDSLKSPNREVGDRSFLPTKDADATLSNPPTGRLGIVHSCLQKAPPRLSQIPQPGGWGSFIPAYKRRRRDSLKSPNREVGDRSFLPTKGAAATLSNPPTGRLGIVHSCLQKTPTRLSQIPQPGGWGSFIPAYKRRRRDSLKSPNREVG